MNQLQKQYSKVVNSNLSKYVRSYYLQTYLIFASTIIIFLYAYGFIAPSGDTIIPVHDNLDSEFAIRMLLSDTNTWFSTNKTIIPNIMNGIPRIALPSEFNITSNLYYFVNSEKAYVINELLIRIIAFIGMLLLLKEYFFQNSKNNSTFDIITITGISIQTTITPNRC